MDRGREPSDLSGMFQVASNMDPIKKRKNQDPIEISESGTATQLQTRPLHQGKQWKITHECFTQIQYKGKLIVLPKATYKIMVLIYGKSTLFAHL